MAKTELTTTEVENPYRPGENETVPFNARESNARTLRLGPAQTKAYDRVWGLYYMLGYWRNGAVDPSNTPVDCQQVRQPITEAQVHAGRELEKLRAALGQDWQFIEKTCLLGLSISEVANIIFDNPTRKQKDQTAWHIKSAYNKAVVEMGLSEHLSVYDKLKAYQWGKVRAWLPGGKPGIDEGEWEI